jgi:hypothetical protein
MDIIENLKTFIAVVDTGNFTGASRKLKVAVSVIKKRIDQLEAKAGVQLFERSTRRMTLTDAGRRHLLKTRATVNQVDLLLSQMASRPNCLEGHLRIKVPNGLLGALVGENLNRFQDLNPGISMEVLSIDRPINPIEEGFDASVTVGPTTWPGCVAFRAPSYQAPGCGATQLPSKARNPFGSRRLAQSRYSELRITRLELDFSGEIGTN